MQLRNLKIYQAAYAYFPHKMIVKKFQGETEKDAILKAQEELGNNAVVLNVKTIKQRGILKLFKKDVVEVTAALEEEELS